MWWAFPTADYYAPQTSCQAVSTLLVLPLSADTSILEEPAGSPTFTERL